MNDDEIMKLLGKGGTQPVRRPPPPRARPAPPAKTHGGQKSFEKFTASQLYCPTCQRATPVKERLMLYLGDGNLYGFYCSVCNTSVGTRKG